MSVKITDVAGVKLSGHSTRFTNWRQFFFFFFLTNGKFERLINNYGCGRRTILLVNLRIYYPLKQQLVETT